MKLKVMSLLFMLLISRDLLAGNITYQSKKSFIQESFSALEVLPQPQKLWLNKDLQTQISQILGHKYPKIRLNYWQYEDESLWFLEEIGKERPISFGIHVKAAKIKNIQVLVFRESRGGEIHMQAFRNQFNQVGVGHDGLLNQSIDGISGATLSVNAMKKIARLAILLHNHVNQN